MQLTQTSSLLKCIFFSPSLSFFVSMYYVFCIYKMNITNIYIRILFYNQFYSTLFERVERATG